MAQKALLNNMTAVPASQREFVAAAMAEAARRERQRSVILFWEEIASAFSTFAQEDCFRQMEDEARQAGMWDLVHRAQHMQNQCRKVNKAVAA